MKKAKSYIRKTRKEFYMRISSLSDRNGRRTNQDSSLIKSKVRGKDKLLLCMVADGMGGTDDGTAASLLTQKLMERWFDKNADELLQSRDFENKVKESITEVLQDANEKATLYSREKGFTTGSTAMVVLFFGNKYIAANIGDSRLYKFSRGESRQITRDQTLAQLEVERGNLTPEEAKTDKRSHTLLQCIGMDEDLEPEFFQGTIRKGEYYLICSDGMYNRVDISELEQIVMQKKKDTKKKLMELIIRSKQKGEKDNITGILVEI